MHKTKKIKYAGLAVAVVALLGSISGLVLEAKANIFPNTTKSVFIETLATGGTTCGTLLEAVNHDRTLVYGTIRTNGANDGTILADGFVFLNNQGNLISETLAPYILPANISLTCTRANNKPFSFRVSYVDYNLSLIPDYQVSVASISVPVLIQKEILLEDVASDSIMTTYGTMTAGDMILAILLFIIIMLLLVKLFFSKI